MNYLDEIDKALMALVPEIEATTRRFKNGSQAWKDYLLYLAILPKMRIVAYKFLPATKDEKLYYQHLIWQYAALSRWLDYLVPGDKPPPPDLFFSKAVSLKPRAELSLAVLNLAVELLPRCAQLQDKVKRPVDLWFSFEMQTFESILLESGFITGKAAGQVPKEETAKSIRWVADFLKDGKITDFLEDGEHHSDCSESSGLSAAEALILFAAEEAEKDSSFRYSRAYVQYQKSLRCWARAVRGQTGAIFKQTRFENGKKLPDGRNAKREPRIATSKGFVNKTLQKGV